MLQPMSRGQIRAGGLTSLKTVYCKDRLSRLLGRHIVFKFITVITSRHSTQLI